MTIQELPDKSIYRIFIPSKTRNGTLIPDKVRSRHIDQIMARCSDVNGGGTIFHNVKGISGFFRLRNDMIMLEGVSIIETAGRQPLSENELELLAKQLDQEAIYMQEMGSCRSIFASGEIEEITASFEATSIDGSKSVFHREDSNGEVRYVRLDYDEYGEFTGISSLTEAEMAADEEDPEDRDPRNPCRKCNKGEIEEELRYSEEKKGYVLVPISCSNSDCPINSNPLDDDPFSAIK